MFKYFALLGYWQRPVQFQPREAPFRRDEWVQSIEITIRCPFVYPYMTRCNPLETILYDASQRSLVIETRDVADRRRSNSSSNVQAILLV
jgi:hypothetical protein